MPIRLITLTLALPLLFGGCARPGAGRGSGLTLLLNAHEREMPGWRSTIGGFTEEAKVEVSVRNVPGEAYYPELKKMIAAGRPPDVAVMDSTRFAEFVTTGSLESLDSRLKQQTDIAATDFVPGVWKAFQYQGGAYGLPFDVGVLAVAYNLDMFELSFLPRPGPQWTWADFLKAAQQLTRDRDEDGRIDVYGTTLPPWWQVFVWQNGADLVDDPTNPTKSTLSAPAAQEALQFVADLYLKHRLTAKPSLTAGAGRTAAFAAGRAAMVFMGRRDANQLSKVDAQWTTASLPRGKAAANLGVSACLTIPKGARHADEAWKLLSYMGAYQGQKALVGAGFITPARMSLLNSESFRTGAGGASGLIDGTRNMHPLPFTPRYAEISRIWDEELARLWTGEGTVQDVTRRIDERVNAVLSQSRPATAWLLPVERHHPEG